MGQRQQQGRWQRRGPKGYTRSDDRIKEDICERLIQSTYIDSSEITVEVRAGRVTFDGTVPERRMKHAIEDLADSVAGVNDVENRIRVSQNVGWQSSSDRSASQSQWSGARKGRESSGGTSGSTGFGSNAGGSSSSTTTTNTASRGPGSSQSLAGQSTSSSSTAKPAE